MYIAHDIAPARIAASPRPEACVTPELRVLTIDDDPTLSRVLRQALDLRGHRVTAASEPAEALALLENRPFDVLCADLNLSRLGRLEGLDLIERARYLRPRLRIVVLTGADDPEVLSACREKGADRIVIKGGPWRALFEEIESEN
jgi:CheY-like chemotaxis protein